MMDLDASTLWVVLGIALMIGEMLTGGFFLVFVALGCFAGSLMASWADQGLAAQFATVAAVSVLGVITLRKPIQRRLLKSINISADIGKEIQIDQAVPPHQRTRIKYQGTTWEANNVGSEDIKEGDRVVIVGVDGIVLLLRKVN